MLAYEIHSFLTVALCLIATVPGQVTSITPGKLGMRFGAPQSRTTSDSSDTPSLLPLHYILPSVSSPSPASVCVRTLASSLKNRQHSLS